MKILLVEDEPKLSSFVKEALESFLFTVDVAPDGLMGQKLALKNEYDMFILDVIVPYINGIELCKEIRKVKPAVPILMLTALGTTEDKLSGFEAGVDDYLVKPFEIKELIARIKALTRRNTNASEVAKTLVYSNLILNLERKNAVREGNVIELTAKEYGLLEYLMRNPDRVISRSEIAEHVWDIHFDTGTNVVDVYINFLRKKVDRDFEPKLIRTQIGMGYIFSDH
jgi:DNA-binding response OmpR family regulator